ncbi:hypothetical protein ACHHYP_09710 [Achlya hypogyna]|uniref:Uncharacterized protein n=1 Tax=Achlya hypogyna TaxID=1202772 RepID=A0A1V9YMK7_ACHHY|nr:hypothetical protein ACHHYP_09710 [Achlya hypogyna]
MADAANEDTSEFGLDERLDDGSVEVDKMLQAPSMAFASPTQADALSLMDLAQQTDEILTNATAPTSAYATHPDFQKLTPLNALPGDVDDANAWLRDCPVHAKEWVVYEARLRPDVASTAIHELVSTIVLTDGFKAQSSATPDVPGAFLFTSSVTEPVVASLQTSAKALFAPRSEHVFSRLGVAQSKLRVLRLYVGVAGGPPSLGHTGDAALHRRADLLFDRLRAALVEVGYALAMLSTPAFCDDASGRDLRSFRHSCACLGNDPVLLDPDYVADVRRAFDSEMKSSLRELALSLEEYAHEHELATAQVLSLLEPLYVKHGLSKPHATPAALPSRRPSDRTALTETPTATTGLPHGECVARLAHNLWAELADSNRRTIQAKVGEKQAQVTRRVEYAKELAAVAVATIVQSAAVQDAHSLQAALGSAEYGDGAVLYEANAIVGKTPAKLFVAFERVVCKCGILMFASVKNLPFDAIRKYEMACMGAVAHPGRRIDKPTVLGLSVIALTTVAGDVVQITLSADVDRVYELLSQVGAVRSWV